jgi:hypothetical protein
MSLTLGEIVKGMSNRTSRGTDIMLTTDTCQKKSLSISCSEYKIHLYLHYIAAVGQSKTISVIITRIDFNTENK